MADRAIAIWPHVVNITKFWKRHVPSKQPQSNNFKSVASTVNDPLTTVKLKFFTYVASVLRPYLERYQNNDPLVPMMACHALYIIKKLMGIVYKTEYVASINDIKQLKKFELKDKKAMKRCIFFGCAAQSELDFLRRRDEVEEKAVSDLNVLGKSFVVGIIFKIKSRMLVGSSFLHQAACLDPS